MNYLSVSHKWSNNLSINLSKWTFLSFLLGWGSWGGFFNCKRSCVALVASIFVLSSFSSSNYLLGISLNQIFIRLGSIIISILFIKLFGKELFDIFFNLLFILFSALLVSKGLLGICMSFLWGINCLSCSSSNFSSSFSGLFLGLNLELSLISLWVSYSFSGNLACLMYSFMSGILESCKLSS